MINRTGTFLSEFDGIGRNLEQALGAFEASRKKLLPGGKSISVTANQILALGISNLKTGKNRRGVDTIIPNAYLGDESGV